MFTRRQHRAANKILGNQPESAAIVFFPSTTEGSLILYHTVGPLPQKRVLPSQPGLCLGVSSLEFTSVDQVSYATVASLHMSFMSRTRAFVKIVTRSRQYIRGSWTGSPPGLHTWMFEIFAPRSSYVHVRDFRPHARLRRSLLESLNPGDRWRVQQKLILLRT